MRPLPYLAEDAAWASCGYWRDKHASLPFRPPSYPRDRRQTPAALL